MNEIDLKKLSEPFPANRILWRVAQSGIDKNGKPWAKVLAYIDSRAVYDRLDDIVGIENWQTKYDSLEVATSDSKTQQSKTFIGAICSIGIKINGEWVWKSGGGDVTDYEAFKGALSSAEKRAGVPWGIGRYLYDLTETWADCKQGWDSTPGWNRGETKKDGVPVKYMWKPKALPAWALPENERVKGQLIPNNPEAKKTDPKEEKKKPPTDNEQIVKGNLISGQVDFLRGRCLELGISNEQWLKWIDHNYGVKTAYNILEKEFKNLCQRIEKEHLEIKSFGKEDDSQFPSELLPQEN